MQDILPFAAFGLWSVLCVFLGAWLMHRKQSNLSPLPEFKPAEMFNWMRTGKTQGNEGDEPPPYDQPDTKPVNYQL